MIKIAWWSCTQRQLASWRTTGLVELPLRRIVDVLDARRGHLQLRLAQRAPDASVLAVEPFGVDEQAEAFVKGQARDLWLRLLLPPRGDQFPSSRIALSFSVVGSINMSFSYMVFHDPNYYWTFTW